MVVVWCAYMSFRGVCGYLWFVCGIVIVCVLVFVGLVVSGYCCLIGFAVLL